MTVPLEAGIKCGIRINHAYLSTLAVESIESQEAAADCMIANELVQEGHNTAGSEDLISKTAPLTRKIAVPFEIFLRH